MRRLRLALMCVLLTAAPTFAADRIGLTTESVVDPNAIEFVPSPDHNTTGPDGQWLVDRYNLEYYRVGEAQPFWRVNLGRPTPSADGKIHLSFDETWGVVGESYEARVSVYGAVGSATSAVSNAFGVSGPCQYALSATSSFGVAGGAGSVNVVTADKCTWTLTSPASWLTVQTSSSNGSGTATFAVAANTSASPRSVDVAIAGQTLTIAQAGSCTKTLDASGVSLTAAGGSGTIGVTAPSGCSWGSAGSAAWLQVTNGSGSGSGSVGYSAAANSTPQVRSTTLTIAGLPLTVTQAGVSAPCVSTVTPTSMSIPAMGASGNLAVTSQAGCEWTATSSAGWIRLFSSGISKKGIGYRVEINPSSLARTATLTIAGQTILVTQKPATVSNTMNPVSSGGNATIPAATMEPSEAGKTSGASRTATPTVGPVAAVPTATALCVYTVVERSAAITVTTAPGCQWKVATTASWIRVSSMLMSGSGTAAYSLSVNNTPQRRTGTMVVAGRIITVEQNAADVPQVAVAARSDLQTLQSATLGGGTVSRPSR